MILICRRADKDDICTLRSLPLLNFRQKFIQITLFVSFVTYFCASDIPLYKLTIRAPRELKHRYRSNSWLFQLKRLTLLNSNINWAFRMIHTVWRVYRIHQNLLIFSRCLKKSMNMKHIICSKTMTSSIEFFNIVYINYSIWL